MNLSGEPVDIIAVATTPAWRPRLRTLLAVGVGASLVIVPGAADATADAPAAAVVVVGSDAARTAEAIGRAGGAVDRILDSVGGASAQLTQAERRALEAEGFRVVDDAAARVTSSGFDEAGDLVQVAALNPLPSDPAAAGPGAGVGVALLDTGVAPVAGLGDRLAEVVDLTDEADGIDRYGHGTFMAGLIVGQETGVAPAAHLVSVKIAGADGTTALSTVLDGIDFIVETRDEFDTRVLSLSLGVDATGPWVIDPLALATEYATAAGILVVTAAGNEAGKVTSPGIAPSALTVGATDHHDTASTSDDVVATWSGSTATKPEVVAPGEAILSLRAPGSTVDQLHPAARVGDGWFRGSGTSMATALTAGAAAVLGEQAPDATPRELKAMLVRGARALGSGARTVDIGGAEQLASLELVRPAGPVVDDGRLVSWTGSSWSGTRWTGTRWTGTRWTGTRWTGTRWTGTRWTGNSWTGTRWAGTRWTGTRWTGTRWAGTRWAGTRWAGTRWAASHFGG